MGSCICACINETRSLANLKVLILALTGFCCLQLCFQKYGLNLLDLPENVFQLCMHGCTYYPDGIMVYMNRQKWLPMLPVEWVASDLLDRQLATCLLTFYCKPYFMFNFFKKYT